MTQNERLLEHLKRHRSITTLEAINSLGITRLSARIYELTKNGYVFRKNRIKVPNRYGKMVPVIQYVLVDEGAAA